MKTKSLLVLFMALLLTLGMGAAGRGESAADVWRSGALTGVLIRMDDDGNHVYRVFLYTDGSTADETSMRAQNYACVLLLTEPNASVKLISDNEFELTVKPGFKPPQRITPLAPEALGLRVLSDENGAYLEGDTEQAKLLLDAVHDATVLEIIDGDVPLSSGSDDAEDGAENAVSAEANRPNDDKYKPKSETADAPTVVPEVEFAAIPEAAPEDKPTVELVAEPEAAPAVEPTAEPEAEAAVEPTIELVAEPEPEPAVEPKAEPKAEPEAEPMLKRKTVSKGSPAPESNDPNQKFFVSPSLEFTPAAPRPSQESEITDELELTEEAEIVEEPLEETLPVERHISVWREIPNVIRDGNEFRVKATLVGYDDVEYALQWQYDDGKGAGWRDEPGANALELKLIANPENVNYDWRILVTYTEPGEL